MGYNYKLFTTNTVLLRYLWHPVDRFFAGYHAKRAAQIIDPQKKREFIRIAEEIDHPEARHDLLELEKLGVAIIQQTQTKDKKDKKTVTIENGYLYALHKAFIAAQAVVESIALIMFAAPSSNMKATRSFARISTGRIVEREEVEKILGIQNTLTEAQALVIQKLFRPSPPPSGSKSEGLEFTIPDRKILIRELKTLKLPWGRKEVKLFWGLIKFNLPIRPNSIKKDLLKLFDTTSENLHVVRENVTDYLAGRFKAVQSYNLLPPDPIYAGGGTLVRTDKPGEQGVEYEGEMTLIEHLYGRPKHEMDARRNKRAAKFGVSPKLTDPASKAPKGLIKDESQPTGLLPQTSGGAISAINLGPCRVLDLVKHTFNYLYSSLGSMAGKHMIYMGVGNMKIKFFGPLMVGKQTLEKFLSEKQPVTKDKEKAPFVVLTRPLVEEECEKRPFSFALVDAVSGQVKYIFPPGLLSAHLKSIATKMGVKFSWPIRGKELARKTITACAQAVSASDIKKAINDYLTEKTEVLTEGEKDLFKIIIDKMIEQPDVMGSNEKQWLLREVIPGYCIGEQTFMPEFAENLSALERDYQERTDGYKKMGSELRKGGNLYTLKDFLFLVMFSSDRGSITNGVVAKLISAAKAKGLLDPSYAAEAFEIIREDTFKGAKIFAADIGELSEISYFSDQPTGPNERLTGEGTLLALEEAATANGALRLEDRTYARELLGIPTAPGPIVMSSRLRGQYSLHLRTWAWIKTGAWFSDARRWLCWDRFGFLGATLPLLRFRTSLVAAYTSQNSGVHFDPDARVCTWGVELKADNTPGEVHFGAQNPLYASSSRAVFSPSMSEATSPTMLVGWDNTRATYTNDRPAIQHPGFYGTAVRLSTLAGTGTQAPAKTVHAATISASVKGPGTGRDLTREEMSLYPPEAAEHREEIEMAAILKALKGDK